MVFTSIRLSYVYNLDITDITHSSVTSTTIGILQLGIAVMVASSALLRPVFDRTLGAWLGLSLRSSQGKFSGPGGGGGGGSGPAGAGAGADHDLVTIGRLTARRKRRFRTMSSGDERLQWELTAMDQSRCERETTVHGGRASDEESIVVGSGKITVTKSTVVE